MLTVISSPITLAILELYWFEQSPDIPILGRVVLVMRPKKIVDEDYTKDGWQIDD